jgi:hypothetical protein
MDSCYARFHQGFIYMRKLLVFLLLCTFLCQMSYAEEGHRDRKIIRPSAQLAALKEGDTSVVQPIILNHRDQRVKAVFAKSANTIQIFYIVQRFAFGSWHTTERNLEVLDDAGRVIEDVYQIYENSEWVNEDRFLFQYDGANQFPSVIIWQEWDVNGNDWFNFEREILEYNDQGKETDLIIEYWDDDKNEWIPNDRTVTSYTDAGEYLEMLFYYWEFDEWELIDRMQWIYENDRLVQMNEEYWDGEEWWIEFRTMFKYDNDGNNILRLTEYYDEWDDEWFPEIRYHYSYDADGNEIESILQWWFEVEEDWLSFMRTISEYDNRNNLIQNIIYSRENEDWIPSSRMSMQYDGNDQMQMLLFEAWTGEDWRYTERFLFMGFEPTFVLEDERLPIRFELMQNYPNPFNPLTTIQFSIPEQSSVTLIVYDALGRKVAVVIDEELQAGTYSQLFDAGHLASGVYVYQLRADDYVEAKRLILMK